MTFIRYSRTHLFKRQYRKLNSDRQKRVDNALRMLATALPSGTIPHGLGLKKLGSEFYEVRSGIKDRIIFRRHAEEIELNFVGSHDDIKRFLKSI